MEIWKYYRNDSSSFLDPTLILTLSHARLMRAVLIDEFDYFNLPGLSVGVKL